MKTGIGALGSSREVGKWQCGVYFYVCLIFHFEFESLNKTNRRFGLEFFVVVPFPFLFQRLFLECRHYKHSDYKTETLNWRDSKFSSNVIPYGL